MRVGRRTQSLTVRIKGPGELAELTRLSQHRLGGRNLLGTPSQIGVL